METISTKLDLILSHGIINKYDKSYVFTAHKITFSFTNYELKTNDINEFINSVYQKIIKYELIN